MNRQKDDEHEWVGGCESNIVSIPWCLAMSFSQIFSFALLFDEEPALTNIGILVGTFYLSKQRDSKAEQQFRSRYQQESDVNCEEEENVLH
jgi:hypothetical protein